MEDGYVYIYRRDGKELCTPSYRLAYVRSEDGKVQAINLSGSIVDIVTE